MSQKTLSLRDDSGLSEGISVTLPIREVTSLSDGVLVTYEFGTVIVQDDPFCLGACFCKIAGFGQNGTAGEPAVPILLLLLLLRPLIVWGKFWIRE